MWVSNPEAVIEKAEQSYCGPSPAEAVCESPARKCRVGNANSESRRDGTELLLFIVRRFVLQAVVAAVTIVNELQSDFIPTAFHWR